MMPLLLVTPPNGTFRLHKRLQRWRHREGTRHPGLFPSSLTPAVSPPLVTIQRLRTGRCQVLISNTPVLLCDGCGALLDSPYSDQAASSASTVSPAIAGDESSTCWISCDHCSFITPLGSLRRLLGMPDDRGPSFEPAIAQALLVEAVGAPSSCKLQDKMLREWILDANCRMEGLDGLCGALGIRDEQLDLATIMDHSDETMAIIEAERFLERAVPNNFMPTIPFSAMQVCAGTPNNISGQNAIAAREAASRAKPLVTEAVRVWHHAITNSTGAAVAVVKLRALGKEFLLERTRARSSNSFRLHSPGGFHDTQQPSNIFVGDATGAIANS